jgi:energy-coupling factor transporter ATP-binding protein EcfA2
MRASSALTPGELAEAAVLGDLGLVLEILGWFLPLGGVLQGLAIVPFALLAARHRSRAVVFATLTAATVAFLVGGPGIVLETFLAGTLGWSIGTSVRRGERTVGTVGRAVLSAFVPLLVVSLVLYGLSTSLRNLAFAQIEILWRDLRRVLLLVKLRRPVEVGNKLLRTGFHYWWLTLPAGELLVVVAAGLLVSRYLPPLLARMTREAIAPRSEDRARVRPLEEGEPSPVPLSFSAVSYRYPGADRDAISHLDLVLQPGSLTAVIGPNGSGKSTLSRLVSSSLSPTSGAVSRPGAAGLGRQGGTAVVFQRPESQVLGVRVRDDVLFGLPRSAGAEVASLLAKVGLDGFADRETATLSGGELQRLALAGGLARHPALVVSDESTAMLDSDGREQVLSLLGSLADEGVAVLHVTHRHRELSRADQVVTLLGGRRIEPRVSQESSTAHASEAGEPGRRRLVSNSGGAALGPPLVVLEGVGYLYGLGTPWERRGLADVTLEIGRGEGIVVTGSNGSGKSTLAWILAGLLSPTEGRAEVAGAPIAAVAGQVGIAFQHARLQLLRPEVMADVSYGADRARAIEALCSVGFDPDRVAARRVDELSGGEQRRVALAGLLVTRPRLLVLDEPLAGLDQESASGLVEVLARLRRDLDVATVVISHDLEAAELLGDRLVVLDAGRVIRSTPIGVGEL